MTGRLETMNYKVEGPIMLFFTTTAIELDEELLNRCIVLSVDEGQAQTQAIHRLQRRKRTMEGWIEQDNRDTLLKLHRNAQRLLKPLKVLNPYSNQLTFLDDRTRMRRDHEKYLTLIEAIALIHQKQRPIKTETIDGEDYEYTEVLPSDIALANKLADEVLGRCLDEMPPQTRLFLGKLEEMVSSLAKSYEMEKDEVRFTRRDIRSFMGWSYDQVRVHLGRLIELEYVLIHKGSRGQSFVHELLYDGRGKDGRPFLMGLLDIEKLDDTTNQSLGGQEPRFGGSLGPHWVPFGGRLGTPEFDGQANDSKGFRQSLENLENSELLSAVEKVPIVEVKASRNGVSLGGH